MIVYNELGGRTLLLPMRDVLRNGLQQAKIYQQNANQNLFHKLKSIHVNGYGINCFCYKDKRNSKKAS